VLLFGADYWKRVLDLDVLVEEGTIAAADRELVRFVETAEEGVAAIEGFYRSPQPSRQERGSGEQE
jgi:predicted Rossmann-fold nucleotide-binding protein